MILKKNIQVNTLLKNAKRTRYVEEGFMNKKVGPRKEKPDPERMAILRSLPIEVKQQISGDEAQAFLYNEELPDSLLEKLKDYLLPNDK